ncbi:RBBP9/YdeN family alpha/beta hydrolase [Nocardia sp. NPDC052566]|uniref:RBBP9/YdeN family alpha/beta hydrolase n=1 Tax=Nocardia sp. NPDC052566 TaxID=3364330 RepID=UPI0037C7382E
MSTVVVSHGYGAHSDSVWFPYLTEQLTALGHRVVVPDLPGTDAPQLDAWRKALAASVIEAGTPSDIILVGHSIGGVNVLRLLEEHEGEPFAGAVLVSTAAHEVGYTELASFFDGPFDWVRIRSAADEFRVLAAADDPVNVPDPVEHVGLLVRALGATATLTATGGHLGATPDDHIELPEAVRLVTEIAAVRA